MLLKSGIVLTLDPKIGDFEQADVLIDRGTIVDVRPDIVDAAATVVDATDTIVMPGFVDTHHHQYQSLFRALIPNGLLADYSRDVGSTGNPGAGVLTPLYRPEDAYAGELLASLGQLHMGVTTVVDTSQVANSPEHTDACIQALKDSGRRTVFAYAAGAGPSSAYPQDVRRLRKQYFSSPDQLLSLALHAGLDPALWTVAREVDAPIVSHGVNQAGLESMFRAGLMRSDNQYIHGTDLSAAGFKLISDSGGGLSIACAIEMTMGHGVPPIQEALDHGLAASLSSDVETNMTPDFFTIMRAAFTLLRMRLLARHRSGETGLPALATCQDVLRMATINGARVVHLDHKIGTLTPGKDADIVMLATNAIGVAPVNNAYGAVVVGMDTSHVRHVLVAGRFVKWDWALVGVDEPRVIREATASRDHLMARTGWSRSVLGTGRPGS